MIANIEQYAGHYHRKFLITLSLNLHISVYEVDTTITYILTDEEIETEVKLLVQSFTASNKLNTCPWTSHRCYIYAVLLLLLKLLAVLMV